MKKILFTFFIALLLTPFYSFAQSEEVVRDFRADIQINSNATFNVVETIQYDFGSLQKHGIYRYIPFKYKTDDGKTRLLEITNASVTNEKKEKYNFTKSTSGNFIEFKIGDADKYVTGLKTYVISYKVNGVINYFDSRDELYWNVTGNGWKVPLEKASVTLTLPSKFATSDLNADSFIGMADSKEKGTITHDDDPIDTINFSSSRVLSASEGLTVVAGFPKGTVAKKDYIYEVPFLSTLLGKLWLGANIFLPLVTLIIMFSIWIKRGRDPRGRGTIIAQYDAPDGVDAIAVGTLVDQRIDKKDISAGIIDLAIKGHLKIKRLDGKGVFKAKDYELTKLKDNEGLNDYEAKILSSLFKDGETVTLNDLRNSFARDMAGMRKMVFESLATQGYFKKSPAKITQLYALIGIPIVFIGMLGAAFVPGFIALGSIVIIFGFFMPARTLKGVTAKEHILGLKEYLSVAEKDRIKFHNAPDKNPQTFEKYLPYAMALGVEKEWGKQFEGIFKENPSWYNDPSMSTFSAVAFASSMDNFSSSAGAVSVPASSGGSGLGGGGFSGGGMGGGGGGSW